MSVPSPYTQRGPSGGAEPREDCRDYLRTGRCKYGASCKYNHPPNVQSGGGMKGPVDPSEPMFPIRPNEPVCQYYMKHGTCKFGQACKFHHPPQSSVTAALMGGGAVVMNVGRKSDVPQIVVNSLSGEATANGTPMMLQFLPQRPEEQDCIFFLKNGRCKYGATCRYHHPINFNQRREGARQRVPDSFLQHSNVQFISQPGGNHHMNYQTGHNQSNGNHMVVTEGPMYRTVDGSSGKKPYHSVVNGDGYCAPVGAPISHNQDHTSSTSSIASSYDTANSNMDHLVPHPEQPQQSSGLWNRHKNNGSHASLNAYDSATTTRQQIGARMPMQPSTSDGSIASRRNRAASYGSASESGAFTDSSGNRGTQGVAMQSTSAGNALPAWRNERSPSFDSGRINGSNNYRPRGDMQSGSHNEEGQSQHQGQPAATSGRRATGRRRSSQAVDDGLSMMTSALLTMLDTPEEAAAEGYEYDQESTDEDATAPMPMPLSGHNRQVAPPGMNVVNGGRVSTDGQVYYGHGMSDPSFMGGLVMDGPMEGHYQDPRTRQPDTSSWLPNWQEPTKPVGRPYEGDAASMSMMRSQHSGPNSPDHHIGLFLP